MLITIDLIKSLNPCEDGIDNFELKYPGYSDTLTNLLSLEDILYDDKIWLVTKIVDVSTLRQWAVECAEFVADNYNREYPGDNRINDCIETTKRYLIGEATIDELKSARSAAESASSAASSAAESASSAAVWAARSASEQAAWSAKSAVWSAAWSAESEEQEDVNLSILIALLKNKKTK